MTLDNIITSSAFQLSGWAFGFISLLIAIYQCWQKKVVEKQLASISSNSGVINKLAKDKSQFIENNLGHIKIDNH